MGKNLNTTPENYKSPFNEVVGHLDGSKLSVGIVCSKFNSLITKSLLMGAIDGLNENNVLEKNITTFWVPGAFEIPVVVNNKLPDYDVIICIACIIQGDTPHFDMVCEGVTQGITMAVHEHKKPAIYCILTTNNQQQAEDRAKPNCKSNKGYEAAIAAIEMANIINDQ